MSRSWWSWVVVGLLCLAGRGDRAEFLAIPTQPPAQRDLLTTREPRIRIDVEYDDSFRRIHGEASELVIREAVAIQNIEWRRYRREWFDVGRVTYRPSGSERDATWVLARFLERTTERAGTIHVNIVGRPLEVYRGSKPTTIGGFAYRGSDAIVISAPRDVSTDLLAYYLFHELGHSWDAYDLPFGGGETTYGSKRKVTFRIDAGNEEIIESSPGPLPRSAPNRAPFMLEEKLARAKNASMAPSLRAPLLDLLHHEPSQANPSYRRKKAALLRKAGTDRKTVSRILARYEPSPKQRREQSGLRTQLARHYWLANDAIARHDFVTAEAELRWIRELSTNAPDVHMLVGAVERRSGSDARTRFNTAVSASGTGFAQAARDGVSAGCIARRLIA